MKIFSEHKKQLQEYIANTSNNIMRVTMYRNVNFSLTSLIGKKNRKYKKKRMINCYERAHINELSNLHLTN